MSNSDEKLNQMANKTNIFPMDLAPKIALVKPSDNKVTAVQGQQAFRTITQPQMRVVMPGSSVQATGTTQLIQTHLMPQAMLKQVDVTGRAQISTLPARTITQTSITVTRPPAPNTFVPRAVTNIGVARTSASTIRTPTPPSNVANLTTNFVRSAIPPRTPSPAGTIISPGSTTWMSGSSPVQLIRTNINASARTRIVSQAMPAQINVSSSGITTISANIVTQSQPPQSHQVQTTTTGVGGGIVQQQSTAQSSQVQMQSQSVSVQQPQTQQQQVQQQQTFVGALSSVLPPARQQTATLVYTSVSNPQQQFTSTQRLAVAAPITGQRQVRPIQLSGARLPTSGIRVSNANISIRAPNIPVLTPTSVLTTMANTVQGRATVSTSNLSARIIQVQQPQGGGGPPQVISGRIGNVMTLQPVIMNTTTTAGANRAPATAKVQPSLTITHVGKLAPTLTAQQNPNIGQTLTTIASSNIVTTVSQQMSHQPITTTAIIGSAQNSQIQHQQQQQSQNLQATAAVQLSHTQQQQQQHQHPQQITQIVGINQSVNASHGHQIIIGNQAVSASATVVPLTLTSRGITTLSSTGATTLPTTGSQIVRANMNIPIQNANANFLPIAKVLPQQQQQQQQQQSSTEQQQPHQPVSVQSVTTAGQNVYIHARSPNQNVVPQTNAVSAISSSASGTTFQSNSGQFFYDTISTSSGVSTVLTLTTTSCNIISSSLNSTVSSGGSGGAATTVSYAPQAGSFAVVPSSNRIIGQIHGKRMIPISNVSQTNQVQAVPVRFNPQLIVDGNQTIQTIQSGNAAHQIISIQQQNQSKSGNQNVSGQTHMLIPVAAKVASAPARPTILRKRDADGQAISKNVAKNLQPTLMQMSAAGSVLSNTVKIEKGGQRDQLPVRLPTPPSRPGSSGGSTTVSANSSPGVDQQEQEELSNVIRRMPEVAFKAVEETSVAAPGGGVAAAQASLVFQQQVSTTSSSSTNGTEEVSARKKPRKVQSRNDSANQSKKNISNIDNNQYAIGSETTTTSSTTTTTTTTAARSNVRSNKENSKPSEVYIKKPRACSLLEGYKQNWKAANNHFQRYSDVKPREERRPTVMDLANQANVVQKVNGWKIYHLNSQMEDLSELETQVYDKLSAMLKCMEGHTQGVDVDRVNDLIKGNMQRSKIVADGINDARTQIMKIFDHKTHVADIIHRCASKRNFKKREKT